MNLIAYAVPFFLLAIALELLWGILRQRNTYRLNDAFSSLMLGILSQARKFVALGIGGVIYDAIIKGTGQHQWDGDAWYTWVLAFFLYDLCYYWLHRFGHERQILWAAHVAHHQSEDYNFSTALRQTSTGFLLGWIFYLPMYLVGIPVEVVVTVGALNLIYQFWVHTQHVPELGWFELVFVSPSNHRVHHAQNDQYMDRNYGGVFILWDRLFGTYQRELPEEPCIYGIRGPIKSWNPVIALTHIYADMLRDMRATTSWINRWNVLWARTGWQPDDVAAIAPRTKSDLTAFERFDPQVSSLTKIYGGVQIAGATAMLTYGQLTKLTPTAYWIWLALLVWTGVATAWWLEGRTLTRSLTTDLPRLVLLAMFTITTVTAPVWLTLSWMWIGASVLLLGFNVAQSRE